MVRTRDDRIDDAVIAAALELLAEKGYAELSIGSVASRAGIHRPAIYRRWPSKRHLVVDVVAGQIGIHPTPDTGDLRADLIAGITTVVVGLRDTVVGSVLPALVADLAADPELACAFRESFFEPRRNSTAAVLESARARGEIRADFDLDFVLDALAAPVYYRALFRHLPLDVYLAEQAVDAVLLALAPREDS
ncbi:TetR/AcrR family transcriptional regulator [Rhodococcus sp. NPDC056743]|uniref:TetR/AcrR family transcriptional regulator n=1 Tax=Rhodococcus sp. NPDC056743 TaxID=3345934 RepID=UPI00366B79E5